MLRRLGYVAIALSIDATTNRTCRLRNATPARLRELIAANLDGLQRVLDYNVDQGIRLYRISSMVVPFGSHPANAVRWWEEEAGRLREIGQSIQRHDLRVSMHPGQFTVLNSPDPSIVESARAELAWHMRLLDGLGVDGSHKVVIHIGGVYGSKVEAIQRFVRVANGLPENWRRRLVIENDERLFSAADVVAISQQTGLPVVFDWLHHQAYLTSHPEVDAEMPRAAALIEQCFATWREVDGPPKVHLSSQESGGRVGAHADWVAVADMLAFLRAAPCQPFDCMLEAKRKDQALLRLRDDLRAHGVVETDALSVGKEKHMRC